MAQHKSHSLYFHTDGPLQCNGLWLSALGSDLRAKMGRYLETFPHKVGPDRIILSIGLPLGYRVNLTRRYQMLSVSQLL